MTGQAFHVVGGGAVASVLAGRQRDLVELVAETYAAHGAGRTQNPDSYFLRFPDRENARIIALPARLRTGQDTAGIKWISSFPDNHALSLPRASAVVVLNDMATGRPVACVEGARISATRTAASAALGAALLHPTREVARVAVVGAGPIAETVLDFLLGTEWRVGGFRVTDLVADRAGALCDRLRERGERAEPVPDVAQAVRGADLVLFATTAAEPYVHDAGLFGPQQTVLNISLRDLGVGVILAAQNVLDDVDHCLKANTSPHLAEQATGNREFVAGTLADVLAGRLSPDSGRVRVFSPFGLGVLDLAVARFVLSEAVTLGLAHRIDDFFGADAG
ncbi:2,3-diaminopropionate biosynthesis protein SbnB [Actinophytocola sp.]|uniref:2,3-diaminopropionate biosynthesis protein SbnB n=1 Tax=Actinophytocola sp. TaxID=1872138 RepID=UPI00389A09DD